MRSSYPEVFLEKYLLKICNKFTREHACRSVISISSFRALLKSHFGVGVLLQIFCIFSEHLFLRTPLGGCYSTFDLQNVDFLNNPNLNLRNGVAYIYKKNVYLLS